MTQIQPTIRSMTWEEAREFGLMHQGLILEYECVSYRLSAGTSDNIHVFRSGVTLYVLTINSRLSYVGLDAYLAGNEEPVDSIFLQGEWAIEGCVGDNWRSLSLTELLSRLIQDFA
jgi:hypothetical protein